MRKTLVYIALLILSSSAITLAQRKNSPQRPHMHQTFYEEMSALEKLGRSDSNRPAVLARLHEMWTTYDVLRRPAIGYLMSQLGDQSGLGPVSKAFFAGEYDTGRELEPDGAAAGANATDAAFRMLILYGTPEDHQRLLALLKLSDDPLRKRGGLCETLLGLSSIDRGPGLPVGYPRERFPIELVIACLDYTDEVETVVSAPHGRVVSDVGSQEGSITVYGAVGVYTQRGCDEAAQAIQNLTGQDFGHRASDPVSQRDKAVDAIKKWWTESHTGTLQK